MDKGEGPGGGRATGFERHRGAGGLREAKEMIISKRTVGPEHLRTRSEATLLGRGEGSGEGGNRSRFFADCAVADFENRAPVEAGRPFLKIKVP